MHEQCFFVRSLSEGCADENACFSEQAMGTSFTEEVFLATRPAAASACLPNGQAAHSAASSHGGASGVLQRTLRLHGLHSLQLLNHANSAYTHSTAPDLTHLSHLCI